MNSVFYKIREEFDDGTSYDKKDIMSAVVAVIKASLLLAFGRFYSSVVYVGCHSERARDDRNRIRLPVR